MRVYSIRDEDCIFVFPPTSILVLCGMHGGSSCVTRFVLYSQHCCARVVVLLSCPLSGMPTSAQKETAASRRRETRVKPRDLGAVFHWRRRSKREQLVLFLKHGPTSASQLTLSGLKKARQRGQHRETTPLAIFRAITKPGFGWY